MSRKLKIFLICGIALIILIMGGGITVLARNNRTEETSMITIQEVLNSSNEVKAFVDGKEVNIEKNNVQEILSSMMENARLMPAFGVALDNEVKEARKSGTWIEFFYDREYEFEGMPFSRLLIEVGGDYTGFNIMRYHDGKYEGRCYYIDLVNCDMLQLYNYIHSI